MAKCSFGLSCVPVRDLVLGKLHKSATQILLIGSLCKFYLGVSMYYGSKGERTLEKSVKIGLPLKNLCNALAEIYASSIVKEIIMVDFRCRRSMGSSRPAG